MKRSIALFCLAIILASCTQESDFQKLRAHLEATNPQSGLNTSTLFAHLKPVYEPLEQSIPFLISKTKSENPADAVTAYMALSELCAQVAMNPTPSGHAAAEMIDPEELYLRFKDFDEDQLKGNWKVWFSQTHEMMKGIIEQDGGANSGSASAPPE